jgi:hypothetical protein
MKVQGDKVCEVDGAPVRATAILPMAVNRRSVCSGRLTRISDFGVAAFAAT